MKKYVIPSAVFSFAYGISLLALGIYMAQFNLAQSVMEKLVEIASIFGLILSVILYFPINLACWLLIFFGANYVLITGLILFTLLKGDFQRLYKSLRIFNFSHYCLLTVLLLADCIIFPYIFTNIQSGVSPALVIFTSIINLTAIAVSISYLFAIRKLKLTLLTDKGLPD